MSRCRRSALTEAEWSELVRMLETARVMSQCPPLGMVTSEEAEAYGMTPEEVAEDHATWSAEEAQAAYDSIQVRWSLMEKLAWMAGVRA